MQNIDCEMKTDHKQPQKCCGTSLLKVSAVDCWWHIQCCLPACQQVAFFLLLSSIFVIQPRGRWFLSAVWGVAQQPPGSFKWIITSLRSSIDQTTSGQVETQFSLSFTWSFTLIEAQSSQLHGKRINLSAPAEDSYFRKACFIPDGDVCKSFWNHTDALWSRAKFERLSKPGCSPNSHNVLDRVKGIWETVFLNSVSVTLRFVCAFAVSSCPWRILIHRLQWLLKNTRF